MGALAEGDGAVMGRIREWFAPESRASSGYLDALLTAQLTAAQGTGSVRSSMVYQAALNLIGDATATAALTGEHSEALQPRLGAIARQMVDQGQSAFELVVGLGGRLDLLPVEITNVVGQADEDSWVYTITRSGPVSTVSTGREQSGRAEFPGSC